MQNQPPNIHHETSGWCTSGWCGTGMACCELGIFNRPPCDGSTMGCAGHRCCAAAAQAAAGHATPTVAARVAPPPSAPPAPPLSECAIARVTYEIDVRRLSTDESQG